MAYVSHSGLSVGPFRRSRSWLRASFSSCPAVSLSVHKSSSTEDLMLAFASVYKLAEALEDKKPVNPEAGIDDH